MLVGLLSFIFNVLIFLVRVASWLLLVYLVLKLILPQNKYTLLVGKYVEPILTPIRAWLFKLFPKLEGFALDLTPVAAWVLLQVAAWLLVLLRNILL